MKQYIVVVIIFFNKLYMKKLRGIHCFFSSRDIVSSVRINRMFGMLFATSETSQLCPAIVSRIVTGDASVS